MANIWISFIVIILLIININIAYNNTNCTYLQVALDGQKDTYLVAYVPYVCMSYGKSSSGMFQCESDGRLRYDEYDDAECENVISSATNLDTGSGVQIDSDSSTVRDYNCGSTQTNETCEFLDIRVYSSCTSFDSQFYDEVYIIDKCLPALDSGKYQLITCTWFNATVSVFDDDRCTQQGQVTQYIYDDDIRDCTTTCRDLSNCRRNFTLCSTHPWSELEDRCDWKSNVARELFCENMAPSYYMVVTAILIISHITCVTCIV